MITSILTAYIIATICFFIGRDAKKSPYHNIKFAIPASYKSDEAKIKINKYGGNSMMKWATFSAALISVGIIFYYVTPSNHSKNLLASITLPLIPLLCLFSIVQTAIWASKNVA